MCTRSLAVAVAGFTGHERLVRPSVVASILAASACWVAAAAGFHLAHEGRKAAAVWALLPSSFILAHGLAAREHQTIRVLFEYCCSLLVAYIVRDRLIYPAAWIDVLGTIVATPVRHHPGPVVCYGGLFYGSLVQLAGLISYESKSVSDRRAAGPYALAVTGAPFTCVLSLASLNG